MVTTKACNWICANREAMYSTSPTHGEMAYVVSMGMDPTFSVWTVSFFIAATGNMEGARAFRSSTHTPNLPCHRGVQLLNRLKLHFDQTRSAVNVSLSSKHSSFHPIRLPIQRCERLRVPWQRRPPWRSSQLSPPFPLVHMAICLVDPFSFALHHGHRHCSWPGTDTRCTVCHLDGLFPRGPDTIRSPTVLQRLPFRPSFSIGDWWNGLGFLDGPKHEEETKARSKARPWRPLGACSRSMAGACGRAGVA